MSLLVILLQLYLPAYSSDRDMLYTALTVLQKSICTLSYFHNFLDICCT